jgi:hypothetical protein
MAASMSVSSLSPNASALTPAVLTVPRRRSEDTARQRRQVIVAIGAFWLAFFLFDMLADVIAESQKELKFDLQWELGGCLYFTLAWYAATPGILWLARRFPIEGVRRWWNLGLHVAASWVISGIISAVVHLTMPLIVGHPNPNHHWSTAAVVVVNASYMMFVCMAFVAAAHAARYFVQSEERERLLMQAQVQTLKAQLNPHFLYNTLNAVSDYAYKDAATAERLVTMLCDLLRQSLSGADAEKIMLADELAFVRRYLDIQQLLLGDRLLVSYSIAPETLSAQVPNFLLQPLVENAVVHGVSRRAGVGRIEVGSRIDHGKLQLWVRDNGPGAATSQSAPRGHGIGISSTRKRLQQIYGNEQRLELESPTEGGFCAGIELPIDPMR